MDGLLRGGAQTVVDRFLKALKFMKKCLRSRLYDEGPLCYYDTVKQNYFYDGESACKQTRVM
jgi:hypothetical protein